MTNLKTIGQLKATARERSLGKYGTLVGASILLFIIRLIITSVASAFIPVSGDILSLIIGRIIVALVAVLMGVFVAGEYYLYMNLIYSQTINVSDIFFGFKQHPEKAMMLQGVFVFFSFLMQLPMIFMAGTGLNNMSFNTLLGLTVFSLAVSILYLYIAIIFAPAFFLLQDFPEWSVSQILSASYRLMKGNRLKYLGLCLSFLPLYLLGAIALFIPLLWINVYVFATTAAFYQDLMAQKAAPVERSDNGLN